MRHHSISSAVSVSQELGFGTTVKENGAELLHRIISKLLGTDQAATLDILKKRLHQDAAGQDINTLDLDVEDFEGVMQPEDIKELDAAKKTDRTKVTHNCF